jgi:hypothetical protein
MPLVESIVRNVSRHIVLLWNDVAFVLKTALFLMWLCMGWYRVSLDLSFEIELGIHIAMELTFSTFRWRNVFGFAGVLMDMVMPFVWVAVVSFGYDLFKLLPVGFQQFIMKCLWNCMLPKVIVAYLAMLFRKLRDNHGRRFM